MATSETSSSPLSSTPSPLPVLDRTRKVIEVLNGPMVFTAPHGLEVYRGIPGVERPQLHGRERYVTQIALSLARFCGRKLGCGASTVVWNDAVVQQRDESNLDPNYLTPDQFVVCPFHQALLRFQDRFAGVAPTLHVDIHGKNHRKHEPCQFVDVGLMPMQRFFKDDPTLHESLRRSLVGQLTLLLKKHSDPHLNSVQVEGHPKLNGLAFGEAVHTMSRQSVLLGTPAVQLELPPCVRRALATDRLFLAAFGNIFVQTYEEVFFGRKTGGRMRRRDESNRRCWSVEEVRWRLLADAPKMVKVPWRSLLRRTRRVDEGFPRYHYEEEEEDLSPTEES